MIKSLGLIGVSSQAREMHPCENISLVHMTLSRGERKATYAQSSPWLHSSKLGQLGCYTLHMNGTCPPPCTTCRVVVLCIALYLDHSYCYIYIELRNE